MWDCKNFLTSSCPPSLFRYLETYALDSSNLNITHLVPLLSRLAFFWPEDESDAGFKVDQGGAWASLTASYASAAEEYAHTYP
jgi:hypothetical protein